MDLYDTLVASRGELESSSLQLAAPLAASHCTRNNYSTTVGTVCLMGKKLSPSSNLGWPQAAVGFRTDSKWAIFSFVTWARSGASSALFHRPYPHVVGKWCREHRQQFYQHVHAGRPKLNPSSHFKCAGRASNNAFILINHF